MNASTLLAELNRSGIRLERRGDKLHVEPPPGMDTVALRQRLTEHKAELLEALKAKTCDKTALLARCKIACEGLPILPTALYEALDDEDRNANPSLETLRAFAESLAERMPKALPAGIAAACSRLKRTLAEHPDMRTAVEVVDPDSAPVLLAVAVRGCGYVCLKAPRKQYDGFKLLELVARWNRKGSNPE